MSTTREMPADAKTKTITLPLSDDKFTVRIVDEGDTGYSRRVQVWMGQGNPKGRWGRTHLTEDDYLGAVEQIEHESSRPLYGNVAHFYKARMKWFPENEYWNEHESMAAAIRTLAADAERAAARRAAARPE